MRNAPLSVGFYADEDKSWADQDCLNLLPVKAEMPGGRSELKLAPLAGLQEFAAYPDASRQRGGYVVEGRQFAVIDQSLCQILPSGSISILGTIPGTSRCAFAHNQIVNGNQLFIATGTSAYVWNTATAALAQVTDTGFMGGLLAKFLGARIITLDPARRFFQWSDLADAGEWNSSSFDASEFSPDRIRSLDTMGDDLVVLNERTIDFYAYTGATNSAFERRPNSLDRGCAASHATVKVDNALFFIGNDGSGYLLRGYQLQRITTHPIEQQWAECDLTKAYAFLHEFEGHKIVYVVMPDGLTWGYDVATNLWHRRGSYGMDRWRLAWLTPWNGGYYGGEFNSGRVFVLNKRYPLEGSACISREFSPGCLHQGGERLTLDALRLQVVRGPRVEASSVLPLAFDLVQDEVGALTIGGGLPDAAVGDTANHQLRTIGGTSPVSFAVTAGSLPAGVSMSASGLYSGTYTTAEHDNAWTVTATDAAGDTATLVEAQYVMDMIGDFEDGNTTDAYSDSVTGSEGTAPYTFAKTLGTLPTSLTLSSAGVLTGTPSVEDDFTFSVTMTDANGVTQTKQYTVTIAEFFLSLGPVAWWKLSEGSGTTLVEQIAARNGTHSASVGGATTAAYSAAITDNSTGSLTCNGVGGQVAANSAFDVATGIGEWSVCASFQFTGADPTIYGKEIFSNVNDWSLGRRNWYIYLTSGMLLTGSYTVSGGTRTAQYGTPIVANAKHRVWLKRESDGAGGYDIALYLDGAEVDRQAIPSPFLGALYAGSDGVTFGNGAAAFNPNNAWAGPISDCAIFAHAVSDADIATDAAYFAAVP